MARFCKQHTLILCCIFFVQVLSSQVQVQNRASKWLFGGYMGIDFMSTPITQIAASQINTGEGSASMADAAGNLLFYTDGVTIWNQLHQVMANGTGLLGNASSSQSALIAKQPGNTNLYYIFTTPSLHYSIVDMNLAAGMGSVTIKNVPLDTLQSEKLTGTAHCSGEEVWIVAHSKSLPVFHSFLLTPLGMNTQPVISNAGSLQNYFQGCMKLSPNGKKIGLAATNFLVNSGFEVFDFDNGSGVVSNALLLKLKPFGALYGCEFSPDGTKFYGTGPYTTTTSLLYQWDLCAGSNTAIVVSEYTVETTPRAWALQLAVNGKIYAAAPTATGFPVSSLHAIHSPNSAGVACSFSNEAIFAVNGSVSLGLPNFISSYLLPPIPPSPPFIFSASPLGCNSVSFSPGLIPQNNCSASNPAFSGATWYFGDPASGAANISSAVQPVHVYASPGSYSVMAVLSYGCRKDTIRQTIVVSGISPTVSVSGNVLVCAGQSTTLSASGADTYSWSNNTTGTSAIFSPTTSGLYNVTGTSSVSGCSSNKTFSMTVSPCTGIMGMDQDLQELSIYPNPNQGELFIDCKVSHRVTFYNLLGEQLYENSLDAGTHTLSTAAVPEGLFLAKIASETGTGLFKLLKTN